MPARAPRLCRKRMQDSRRYLRMDDEKDTNIQSWI